MQTLCSNCLNPDSLDDPNAIGCLLIAREKADQSPRRASVISVIDVFWGNVGSGDDFNFAK
jgi:hypothetical protein